MGKGRVLATVLSIVGLGRYPDGLRRCILGFGIGPCWQRFPNLEAAAWRSLKPRLIRVAFFVCRGLRTRWWCDK